MRKKLQVNDYVVAYERYRSDHYDIDSCLLRSYGMITKITEEEISILFTDGYERSFSRDNFSSSLPEDDKPKGDMGHYDEIKREIGPLKDELIVEMSEKIIK